MSYLTRPLKILILVPLFALIAGNLQAQSYHYLHNKLMAMNAEMDLSARQFVELETAMVATAAKIEQIRYNTEDGGKEMQKVHNALTALDDRVVGILHQDQNGKYHHITEEWRDERHEWQMLRRQMHMKNDQASR